MSFFYSKSQAAFVLTAEKFFDIYPKAYFWTFTFTSVMPDWWYSRNWAGFIRDLQHLHGEMVLGLRVIEVHPGGHGLHYHAILNKRMNVHFVRRLGRRHGIGRVHVKTCDMGAAHYLVPYLSKDDTLFKGIRRWSTVGGFIGVKKRDVVCETPFHFNMEKIAGGKKINYHFATTIFRLSQLWGHVESWPHEALACLGPHGEKLRSVTPWKGRSNVFVLNPNKTWDTIRKPQKPIEGDGPQKIYADGTTFGCMVMHEGRWVHESKVQNVDPDQVPLHVLDAKLSTGEIET